jgi:hypothetical protein
MLGALAAIASTAGDPSVASAGEPTPAAGSWRKLAVRKFSVDSGADLDAAMRDVSKLLTFFKPAGLKVSDLSVVADGPKKVPRVVFRATVHVDVEVGLFSVARDEQVWIRADVTSRMGRCAYDPSRAGYEIKLDLSSSDEPVSANASSLVAAFCFGEPKDGQREVELTSFMQIGPDYGTRVAGRLATNMLIKQTDPFVTAIRLASAAVR